MRKKYTSRDSNPSAAAIKDDSLPLTHSQTCSGLVIRPLPLFWNKSRGEKTNQTRSLTRLVLPFRRQVVTCMFLYYRTPPQCYDPLQPLIIVCCFWRKPADELVLLCRHIACYNDRLNPFIIEAKAGAQNTQSGITRANPPTSPLLPSSIQP